MKARALGSNLINNDTMNTIYEINKGINKPIEFQGLKAQYIVYLAIGLVVLLLAFAIFYIIGLPVYFCVAFTGFSGALLFFMVYRYSHKYGQYGLLKKAAKRHTPVYIRFYSRKVFTHLAQD